MIRVTAGSKPRLARKARLRRDRKTGHTMLLYPERGLVLSASASEILTLCTGARTVGAIVAALVERYRAQDPAVIEREVLEFLGVMAERGLLEGNP